jgi:tetratricopeptide (TPR) repeat protein/CHAT domain-containing protein
MFEEWQDLERQVNELYSQGKIEEAIPLAEQALTIARNIFPKYSQEIATTISNLAYLYKKQGQWIDAEALYRESIGIYHYLFDKIPNENLATNLNDLALLYKLQGKLSEAEPLFKEALEIRNYLFANNPNNDLAASWHNLARLYQAQEKWLEAEEFYLKALDILDRLPDQSATKDLSIGLNSLASLYCEREQWKEAAPLYLEDLKIHNQLFANAGSYSIVATISERAGLHTDQGEWKEAEFLYKTATAISHILIGSIGKQYVTTNMVNLANLYRVQVKWGKSESLYLQALKIYNELFRDRPSKELGTILNNLAGLYEDQGRWIEAENFYKKALAVYYKLFPGKISDEIATTLINLSNLYRSQGRWIEAEPRCEEALKICSHLSSGTPNNIIVSAINNYASLYLSQGRLVEAESVCEEALEICRHLGKSANEVLSDSLNNLAVLCKIQGRWAEAESHYRKALDLRRKLFGDNPNKHLAISLSNLAKFFQVQGKLIEAESHYREALDICRKLFGDNPNNDLAAVANNLASLYQIQGRWRRSEDLYREALSIRFQLFGDNPNNDLATVASDLASLYQLQWRWAEAEFLLLKALEIQQHLFGDTDNIYLASTQGNLAELYRVEGRLTEAKPLYQKAITIYSQLYGERGHPNLFNSYQNYALLLIKEERFTEAIEHFIAAAKVNIKVLADRFQGQTEAERLEYRDRQQHTIDSVLSCLWQYLSEDPEAIAQAFEVIYLWKSVATAVEIALSAAIARSEDPELKQLATERQQLSRQLNQITQQPIENLEAYRAEVNRLQTRINELEKAIALKVPQAELMETKIDRQAINLLVPAGDTLVDFVRFDLYDLVNIEKGEPQYLAFVLTGGETGGIKLVKLGAARAIDELIDKFRTVASDLPGLDLMNAFPSENEVKNPALMLTPYQTQALELRQAILDPLNLPKNQGRVFFAPDGDLNLVPFGILPLDSDLPLDNRIVSDRWSVHYISASRDLRPRTQPPAPKNMSTILANPNYDFPVRQIAPPATPELSKSGKLSTLGNKLIPLPQTEPLALKIAQSLDIEPHLGDAARVDNLRQLRSPQYLIIATHGLHGLDTEGGDNPDPMRDAGLALAGYNTHLDGGELPPELERGVFTARNLLELDLWGTQIAILLACSSGTGTVRQGEGIFGLKRALSIAGVSTTIVSLWDVPVQASILLMDKFFEYYRDGAGGKPASKVLQDAQSYIRNITRGELDAIEQGRIILEEIDKKVAHLAGAEHPLQHPMFWGAWICSSAPSDCRTEIGEKEAG